MWKKKKPYERLPGSYKFFVIGGTNTLWQGSDHLLSITRYLGSERYRRFYFNDIQSFTIQKTHAGKIQNVVISTLAAVLVALALYPEPWMRLLFGILAAFYALMLLINLLRGPTCAFFIRTAVQNERQLSINRLKNANKVLARVKPFIRQYQGDLPTPSLQQALNKGPGQANRPDRHAGLKPARAALFNVHLYMFSLLILLGMVAAVFYFYQNVMIVLVETIVGLAITILAIVALIRQYQYRMEAGIRWISWASAVFTGLYFLGGYIVYIYAIFKDPEIVTNQWEIIQHVSSLSPDSHPLLLWVNLATVSMAPALGMAGLFLVKQSQRRRRS